MPLKKTFDLYRVGRRHTRRAHGISWRFIEYGEMFRQGLLRTVG
jgi:hypothetical protein